MFPLDKFWNLCILYTGEGVKIREVGFFGSGESGCWET